MQMERSAGIVCTALAVVILGSCSGSAYASGGAPAASDDHFGITSIYPTEDGGREWFIDMDDPQRLNI
jgi:hypothetical protein